jgi:hypothetical protein
VTSTLRMGKQARAAAVEVAEGFGAPATRRQDTDPRRGGGSGHRMVYMYTHDLQRDTGAARLGRWAAAGVLIPRMGRQSDMAGVGAGAGAPAGWGVLTPFLDSRKPG